MGAVSTLAVGAIFGLALAAPPGPMNAVIAEESVRRGWRAGFLAGLGAMTADAAFLALAWIGVVGVVARRPTLRAAMVGIGGVLMLAFAYVAVRDARRGTELVAGDGHEPPAGADRRGFLKALALALTNPYQILFWLTVGVGLLRPGSVDVLSVLPVVGEALAGVLVVRTGSATLVVGLFVGIAGWVVGFPAALVSAERRTASVGPVVAYASAAVLAAFGGWYLVDALGYLLAVLGSLLV